MDLLSYICKRKRGLFKFVRVILSERSGKRILCLFIINILTTVLLLYHCGITNSMGLTAFSYLSVFSLFRICGSFVSIWVQKQVPTFDYSFGYERFDVLSVFVSTALSQLSAFFIFKESFERLVEQSKVMHESQVIWVLIGSLVNIIVIHTVENKPFDLVIKAASPNCIQNFIFDCGKSICGIVGSLSRPLLSRMNPYVLLTNVSAVTVIIESLIIENSQSYEADTIAAMLIAILICITMFPLSKHCAYILLQAAPTDLLSTIDKVLKEANTLDGLLEFRQEHFWMIDFDKYGAMIVVRIRRDANEQLILAQLTNQLSAYFHYVTIQIIKDDWSKRSETEIDLYQPYHNSISQIPVKPSKTFAMNNGHIPKSHTSSYSTHQSSRPFNYSKSTPNFKPPVNDTKKVKYKGPKIDIDFS